MRKFNPTFIANSIELVIKDEMCNEVTIHSIFNNCINLQIGERIISIFRNEENKLPFGIALEDEEFNEFKKYIYYDTKVKINKLGIYFDEILIINLDVPTVNIEYECKNKIKFSSMKRNLIYLSRLALEENWSNGFNYEMEKIINYLIYNEESDDISEFIVNAGFLNNINNITDYDCYKFINFFIGRGKGLTPSGDDMLIGMMAMFHIGNFNVEVLNRCMDIYLSNLGEKRTTRISFEYLFYANKKLFITALQKVCYAILYLNEDNALTTSVLELRSFGSTSPIDSIIGILLASKVIINSKDSIIE